jgi:hypothetical protein
MFLTKSLDGHPDSLPLSVLLEPPNDMSADLQRGFETISVASEPA